MWKTYQKTIWYNIFTNGFSYWAICILSNKRKKKWLIQKQEQLTFNFIQNINPKVKNYIYKLWFLIFDKVFPYCDSLERWFKLIILLNMLNKKFINIEILDEFLSNLILITLIKFGDREMCSLFFKHLNSNS